MQHIYLGNFFFLQVSLHWRIEDIFGFKKARKKNRVTLMKIGQNPPIFFVIESAEEKIRIYD